MIEGNNLPTTPVAPPLATQLDPDSQIVQNAQVASDNADNAVEAMNVCDEWKETVQNIQKVMEAVKNVADVRPQMSPSSSLSQILAGPSICRGGMDYHFCNS